MQERYIRWWTPHLSRDFEMLAFGQGGLPFVIFPTSFGRYYQNKDFGMIDAVASRSTAPMRLIWIASITKQFIRRIGCARISHMRM
ncbi:MAG: hypothetical protein DME86_06520 [Verrucomicrobia bacterium]|nr:MAG: hypothetical protein DME86_06520 [Verrucomicrobiota bacterium]